MRQSIWVVGPIRTTVLAVVVAGAYLGLVPGPTAASRNSAQPSKASSDTAAEELQIRELLAEQAAAWNRGDIDSFMTSYWKSDQTLFVGATGVARGWQAVLTRYHRAYPDPRRWAMWHFRTLKCKSDARTPPWCSGITTWTARTIIPREFSRWTSGNSRKGGGLSWITQQHFPRSRTDQ